MTEELKDLLLTFCWIGVVLVFGGWLFAIHTQVLAAREAAKACLHELTKDPPEAGEGEP